MSKKLLSILLLFSLFLPTFTLAETPESSTPIGVTPVTPIGVSEGNTGEAPPLYSIFFETETEPLGLFLATTM